MYEKSQNLFSTEMKGTFFCYVKVIDVV